MISYKLLRLKKDGTLSPLFINKKQSTPLGVWLDAEFHPTKGYAERKGWHCTLSPNAPHLSNKDRIWCKVEVEDFEYYKRPESQGGKWVLAQRMKILRILDNKIYLNDSNKQYCLDPNTNTYSVMKNFKVGDILRFHTNLGITISNTPYIKKNDLLKITKIEDGKYQLEDFYKKFKFFRYFKTFELNKCKNYYFTLDNRKEKIKKILDE